ncbi:unnamed protein product [Rhizophagus irregularis]|uniref:Uncharacterized protein n=1 Tax=Rhizophagus irregularis TaxID=588596 RepID=A0A2I1GU26_9GLOM|nr:hypothetical protein RhiirA4_446209 [Rhizophagus irregularis]CAB4415705.1 unnamed protein product [Rhizophagus irregularis]
MLPQNNNQPPHKTFKTTQEPDKLLGGTPRQARKINELEKVENKARPTKLIAASQSRDFPSHDNSEEEAPSSSIGGANDFALHNSGLLDLGGMYGRTSTSPPFSNHYAKIDSILNVPQTYENGDRPQSDDCRESAIIHNSQTHDERTSSSPHFSNHYAKITSILNDSQTNDNGDGPQTYGGGASVTFPNPQAHDERTSTIIFNPQTYGGRVSSSLTLLRYSSNYYARIPSILSGPQTLPSFPWFLNNPNEINDVSLSPIYNNLTHQQIHLRTLEPDHKPDDPKLSFRL